MTGAAPARVAGERLVLMPERTVYWPARHTLVVADLHVDKPETLRAGHVAAPLDLVRDDLDRLHTALERSGARRLVILGDLYHGVGAAHHPVTHEALAAWRRSTPGTRVTLIVGNHDQRAGSPPADLAIDAVPEGLREPPFVFRHRPTPDAAGYVLAGHVHAGVRLGSGAEQMVLPAFRFGRAVGTLPAFGSLTGAQARPPDTDDVYAIADGAVHAL